MNTILKIPVYLSIDVEPNVDRAKLVEILFPRLQKDLTKMLKAVRPKFDGVDLEELEGRLGVSSATFKVIPTPSLK
jgi:hypothetical protein